MKIVEQNIELLSITPKAEKLIEQIGRVCYKSEDKITKNSYVKFIENLIKRGHLSVLEHASATFKIITNRAIANEIVRHRLASYSQESTRYVAYKSELKVIKPYNLDDEFWKLMINRIKDIEETYQLMLKYNVKPQIARDILPLCLATELVMTANFREWLHIINLRTSKTAHPQIRELFKMINNELNKHAPNIFKPLS